MKRDALALYNDLQTIRLTAAVLYDRGKALERSEEDLAEDIKPLHERKRHLINHAIAHDLGGVICAIKQLHADSQGHLETAQFLKEKSENAKAHAAELLEAIKDQLHKKNSTEILHGDFSATLVDGKVTIR